MKAKKIIFLGPDCRVANLPGLFSGSALSPAAAAWCNGLIKGLLAGGFVVDSFYHQPQPTWPRGPLFSVANFIVPGCDVSAVQRYLNIKGVRGLALARYYRSAIMERLRSDEVKVLITYNFSYENVVMGALAQSFGVRWVMIYADGPKSDEIPYFARRRPVPDTYLTLSYAYHQELLKEVKSIYFPGGINTVECVHGSKAATPRRLVYTGSIHPVMGVDWLARAMRLTHGSFELHVCGKGQDATLAEVVSRDPRVVFHGLVSDEELAEICESAFAFVNPRPNAIVENRYNFPSKLLSYLSYGRPVISTMTPGVSPEFSDVLIVPKAETDIGLAEAIESTMAMPEESYGVLIDAVRSFSRRHAWSAEIQSLMDSGVL